MGLDATGVGGAKRHCQEPISPEGHLRKPRLQRYQVVNSQALDQHGKLPVRKVQPTTPNALDDAGCLNSVQQLTRVVRQNQRPDQ